MSKNEFANLSLQEQQAIRKMRADAKMLAAAYPIRCIEKITVKEKIAAFDRLYNQALKVWDYHRKNGYSLEDESQWAFESMMAFLINPEYPDPGADTPENSHISGQAFWDAFRKLTN